MQNTLYVKHELVNLINISKIITIHYFEYGKDYAFRGESHDFWEIMYTDRGSVEITRGWHRFLMGPGEMVFLKPNEYHNIRADGQHPSNVFIISFETKSQAMRYFEGKSLKIPTSCKGMISQIIKEGRSAFELPMANPEMRKLVPKPGASIGAQQLIRLNLELLLIMLLRYELEREAHGAVFTSKARFDDYVVSQIIGLLEKSIYQNVTVTEICTALHYGKTYISKLFKRAMGQSLVSYYTGLKMTEAKRLIREKAYTITQISEKLGYDTPQYFSKRFKQMTGMSPREYEASVKID